MNMKKILFILVLFCVTFSCRDEDIFKQSAIGFYPEIAANGEEEGSTTHTMTLRTSHKLSADGIVKIKVTNGEFLTTVPPISNDVISLVIPKGTRDVSFEVNVGDDNYTTSYVATFEITSVEGSVRSILPANLFTLFVADRDQEVFFTDDFECANLDKWISHSVSGSNNWSTGNFSDNTYADISIFSSSGIADDWLIMPEINFDDFVGESLSFLSLTRFNDGNLLEVFVLSGYSGSGDPSGASATALSPALDPHRGGGFGDFTPSGMIDLSAMTGTGHVAFHYKASSADDGSGWQIDDVMLTLLDPNNLGVEDNGDCGSTGGGGGGGGSSTDLSLPFNDDFEDCANVGDFNIPSNWIEEVVAGSKTDRGWGCRAFGNNGTQGVRASAFAGDEGTDDAWLITNGQFDLTTLSSAELKFWIESRFSGPGAVSVHWSTNYSGSGDPTAATWTEISDATTQIAAIPHEVFTEVTVSLDAATGNNIHLAFRYAGGTDAASIAYTLDDLSLTGN